MDGIALKSTPWDLEGIHRASSNVYHNSYSMFVGKTYISN